MKLIGRIEPVMHLQGRLNAVPGGVYAPGDETETETMTYILVAEDGTEIPAVVVEEETVFTATANDIREGTVAATTEGVTTGTKVIPSYHSTEGNVIVMPGEVAIIALPSTLATYDYTKLQAIVCSFNSSIANSVAAEKVAIDDNVYDVQSVVALSELVKDAENQAINLGITNDTDIPWVIRYFTLKEIY